MWYMYTTEYYSNTKNKDNMKFAAKCMKLENIILCEIIQTQKDTHSMYSLIHGRWKAQNKHATTHRPKQANKEGSREDAWISLRRENKVDIRGGGREETVLELEWGGEKRWGSGMGVVRKRLRKRTVIWCGESIYGTRRIHGTGEALISVWGWL